MSADLEQRVYLEQLPSPPLSRWLECGWFMQSAGVVQGHPVPPDGCIDIVYERGSDQGSGLRAIGTMTKQQRFDYPRGAFLAGVRFRPGLARTFLGVSAAELTDGSAPLEDLWSRYGRELKRQLDDATSIRDAMRILAGSVPVPDATPTPIQQAIEWMVAANGNADLDVTAGHANLSVRQFRRRCLDESGLTPKRLCRVLRFRHACRIARHGDQRSWTEIAMEAEYFDQAHLIRDFQEFTGGTPMAVFSNT